MIVLGLDLALGRTGWAHVAYEDGALLAHGLIEPATLALDTRLRAISDEVADQVTESVSNVFLEAPFVGGSGDTTKKLAMVHGAVRARLAAGPPVNVVAPAQLKKWATGDGRASKAQMVAEAACRFGVELSSDEADAALVAAWGRHQIARAMADHPTGGAA